MNSSLQELFQDTTPNLDLYRALPENARNQLDDLLVEFIGKSIDDGGIENKDNIVIVCTVFPLVNLETKKVHKFIGVKALVDVVAFREHRSKEFVSVIDSTEHDSDVPDELLDLYNKAKDLDINASLLKS